MSLVVMDLRRFGKRRYTAALLEALSVGGYFGGVDLLDDDSLVYGEENENGEIVERIYKDPLDFLVEMLPRLEKDRGHDWNPTISYVEYELKQRERKAKEKSGEQNTGEVTEAQKTE